MTDQELVSKTADHVKKKFEKEGSGHDWWHLYRVWQLAKYIAAQEKGANILVVELAALLHDIADHKFHNGDMEIGARKAREWLESHGADKKLTSHIEEIIRNISFKSGNLDKKNHLKTLEGQIVHDADKLDALGAIGIGRVFTMSGTLGRPMYNPNPPKESDYDEMTRKWGVSSVHHFYDKLFLLKDRMFTETGRRMAEHRHKFMEEYLEEFYAEWDGKI